MRVALIIGHNPRQPGAANHEKSEFDFYDEFHDGRTDDPNDGAVDDAISMYDGPHELIRVQRKGSAMPVDQVNALRPDFFISWHANAAENVNATGIEVLHWHRSETSRKMAVACAEELYKTLDLPLRHGDGALPRTKEHRGSYLLYGTKMPGVLCEPFFISNPNDWRRVKERYYEFCRAICRCVDRCADILEGK